MFQESSKYLRIAFTLVLLFSACTYLTFYINSSTNVKHEKLRSIQLSATKMHDKWIVVTTVSPPTKDIAILSDIPGWKLLVVGDTKTPTNWSFPNCIYLGIEKQKSLGYSITELIPFKSYTRKNIGYLYAIQHGAQFIYDTDDDNHPNGGILNFNLETATNGLIYDYTSKKIMNPYTHFGQPTIWPRGFPLDKVTQDNNVTYRLTRFLTPSIQQGLVNGDPDVDAIYRLIKRHQNMTSLKIEFDQSAPPLTLPEVVFAPFNSQNTLFHHNAFWALFLPSSVSFRVTDIWRGYWAQRLLWLLGQQLAFFPPNAVQIRNAHNYINDFKEELQFYTQVDKFIDFLSTWNCSRTTFFECINLISNDMVVAKFWGQADADTVKVWLEDLNDIGYQQPTMRVIYNDVHGDSVSIPKVHKVIYSSTFNIKSDTERRLDLLMYCDGVFNSSTSDDLTKRLGQKPSYVFSNLLLVIVFNFPIFENIKFLDTLYKDHFPNMLFCSETNSFDKMMQGVNHGFPQWRIRQISFLNVTSAGGYFGYECAIRAIEMNYQVDGYLVMSDDILLNTWNLQTKDLDQVRFVYTDHKLVNLNDSTFGWGWWSGDMGRKPTLKALNEINEIANGRRHTGRTNFKQLQRIMKQFVEQRMINNVNLTIATIASADLFYVPRSKSQDFMEIMKIFLKHRVFQELAVPCTMAGLFEKHAAYHTFKGDWGRDRQKIFSFFNVTNEFLHPLKLSLLVKDVKLKSEYCDIYMREKISRW